MMFCLKGHSSEGDITSDTIVIVRYLFSSVSAAVHLHKEQREVLFIFLYIFQ